MNRVKLLREEKNLTQSELAEKSGVSLRTIQRIESGSSLKGFTLNSIAKSLETEPQNLFYDSENTKNIEKAKAINLATLLGLIIPFGGIIFPMILTSKTRDQNNKNIGKKILEIQILLTAFLSIFLILSPFIQKYFSIKDPLFLYILILFFLLKISLAIMNGKSLNQKETLFIKLKTNFL